MNENRFYTYVLLDTRKPLAGIVDGYYVYDNSSYKSEILFSHEPFYVGKGRKRRYKSHFNTALKTNRRQLLYRKIRKILKVTGSLPNVFYYKERILSKQALHYETFLIKKIGKICNKTGPLVNIFDEDFDNTGWKHTEEARKKMKGRIVSEEQRRHHSLIMKGRTYGPMSDEAKRHLSQKMIGKNKGKKLTDEHKLKDSVLIKKKWQDVEYRRKQEFSRERRNKTLSRNMKGKVCGRRSRYIYKIYKDNEKIITVLGRYELLQWCESNNINIQILRYNNRIHGHYGYILKHEGKQYV